MLGSIRKFIADRKGAFAIQFALMVVPLTVCTGLAVDGGRAFLARYELAQALDAAALAVGSTSSTTTQENLTTMAQTYVNANFRTKHNGHIKVTLGDNASGVVVNLKGEVAIDTYFMPLIGKDSVLVKAESTVRRGGNNVEVALAIDITGSMDDPPKANKSGERKIVSLQSAATNLINTVISTQQPPLSSYYSRMAIIPWSNNVYISDATLATTLRGAVTGTVPVSAMTWKNGDQRAVAATWRNGDAYTSTSSAKITSITRQGSQHSSRTTRITFTGNPTALANNDYIVITSTTNAVTNPANQAIDNWAGQLDRKRFKIVSRGTSGSGASMQVWFTLQTPTSASNASNFQDSLGTSRTPNAATYAQVQKCFDWNCIVQVSGSNFSPAPVAGDNVYLSGFSGTSAASTNFFALNSTSLSTPWKVATTPAPSTSGANSTFYLQSSSGLNHLDVATGAAVASGQSQLCFKSTNIASTTADDSLVCAIQVTAPVAPALANGGAIRLTGVSTTHWGSSLNNIAANTFNEATEGVATSSGTAYASWLVEQVSGDKFVLSGSLAPNTTVPTGTFGNAQCLVDGCSMISYVNKSSKRVWRKITQCVSERVMGDVDGDTKPGAGEYLGRFYEGDGNGGCVPRDTIIGLDDDRADLIAVIKALDDTDPATPLVSAPHGTTAGQIGMGWASYMISHKWRDVIPNTLSEYQPAQQNAANTTRVVVFMSDGEFNTTHCGGQQASNYNSGSENDDTYATGTCLSANTSFVQAQNICTKLRNAKIRVYTVGFDVPADSAAWTFMQDCATDLTKAYLASTGDELQDAFDEIAEDIARLRIAQ